MEKEKRLDLIDIAKGIGIIFVVFAHVNYTPELLVLIYSFHMPLFFIISGMLYKKEKYPNFIVFLKRRLKTLIVPYLWFSLFSIGYVFISERIFPELFAISKDKYIQYFTQICLAQGSGKTLDVPLWFVLCLFAVEIMYFFISKNKVRIIVPVCLILVCLGWMLESGRWEFDNKLLPWSLDSALFALGFYAVGNLSFPYLKKAILRIKEHKNKLWICAGMILLSFIIWLPITLLNGKITLGSKVLNNGFFLYITGITGTVMIFAVSLLLENSKFLRYCGRNSFYIMATHYMIRKYTVPKIYAFFDVPLYDKKNFAETLIPFILVFCLSLLFTIIYPRGSNMILRIGKRQKL